MAFVQQFQSALISFFVVIDPIGLAVVLPSLVGTKAVQHPIRTASRASSVGFMLLFCSALIGKMLILKLGISIAAFRAAGGLLLFYISFRMVMGYHESDIDKVSAAGEREQRDATIFPLATPLLAGPGGMSLAIMLMDKAEGHVWAQAAVLSALGVVGIVTWLSLSHAPFMAKILGQSGNDILARVLGIILASLSIQFVADGLKALWLG